MSVVFDPRHRHCDIRSHSDGKEEGRQSIDRPKKKAAQGQEKKEHEQAVKRIC